MPEALARLPEGLPSEPGDNILSGTRLQRMAQAGWKCGHRGNTMELLPRFPEAHAHAECIAVRVAERVAQREPVVVAEREPF